MHRDRRKNFSLAIRAIIRGLDYDEVAFRYDEAAAPTALRLCPAARGSVHDAGTVNIAFGCETVPLTVD